MSKTEKEIVEKVLDASLLGRYVVEITLNYKGTANNWVCYPEQKLAVQDGYAKFAVKLVAFGKTSIIPFNVPLEFKEKE